MPAPPLRQATCQAYNFQWASACALQNKILGFKSFFVELDGQSPKSKLEDGQTRKILKSQRHVTVDVTS